LTLSVSALVLEAPRTLHRREFPRPEVGADDGLLRVEACGLCGTDHEQFSGHLFGGFAFIPGHESVGVIEEIGPVAAARWGVTVGDRVAVEVFQSCRACPSCAGGDYRHCRNHGIGDSYGFVPVDRAPGLWGGYAQYQYLSPDSMLLKVPDNLDPVTATLFNPMGAGVRWGATLPQTAPGDVVAILGPGIRGLCSLVAARAAGAEFIMVTGAGARDRSRLAIAREFGADLVVDVTEEDPARALRRAVRRGADVVVDVTAKSAAAFDQALAVVRGEGTIVVAGIRGGPMPAGTNLDLLVYKEIKLIGVLGVDVADYEAGLQLLADTDLPFGSVDRGIAGFDQLPALLESLANGEPDTPMHAVFAPD
jgi:alcohol dehydrogenase